MPQERLVAGERRSRRVRRRSGWVIGAVVLLLGAVLWGVLAGPGGPPPARPFGAGLPPSQVPRMTSAPPDADPARRAELLAEETRIASLRAQRIQLEQEVVALRQEAERRRAEMPGRKVFQPETAASGAAAATAAAAGPAVEPSGRPLRVFVHHRANAPPSAAEEVAQTLRGAGIEVTAVRSSPFVPSTPVVRYFHEEDQAAATRLAGRLGRSWAIQDFRAYAPQPPPGTLEVWLPSG